MTPTLNLGILASAVVPVISGTLRAWGANGSGQLGRGNTTTPQTTPTQIGSDSDWQYLGASKIHSLGIKAGKLYAWGDNTESKLGDGTTTQRTSPVQIGSDIDWAKAAGPQSEFLAGAHRSFGLKASKLYGWGDNLFGYVGDGTTTDRTSPVQLGSDSDWVDISAGGSHCLALKSNGKLYAWGLNGNGQLGNGTTTDETSPIQVGSDTDWAFISAGYRHSVAIKTNGKLYAWGLNTNSRLGDGTTTQRTSPVQIGSDIDWAKAVASETHSLGIKTDGKLYAWGSNANGRTGRGTTTGNTTSPTQVGSDTDWDAAAAHQAHCLAVKTDGKLYSWGANADGGTGLGTTSGNTTSPSQIGSDTDWKTILAAGQSFSLAVK